MKIEMQPVKKQKSNLANKGKKHKKVHLIDVSTKVLYTS